MTATKAPSPLHTIALSTGRAPLRTAFVPRTGMVAMLLLLPLALQGLGQHWVRVDNQYLLVGITSGIIAALVNAQ